MTRRLRIPLTFGLTVLTSVTLVATACITNEVKSGVIKVTDVKDSGRNRNKPDPGEDAALEEPPPQEDPPLPDGAAAPGAVYAHTADTLYLFEPIDRRLMKIGKFSCIVPPDDMLDIALDRDGVMYGTTREGFVSIRPSDGNCTFIKREQNVYPNSLSFVPAGTVDPAKEVLVGYQYENPDPNVDSPATVYVKIDPATGVVSKVGDLNPSIAKKWKASGDLIALIRNGNKAYLTVKEIAPDASARPTDFLAEIDPTSGRVKTILGDIKKADLWGLGFWAGVGYGFNASGEIIEVNMADGGSKVLNTLEDDTGLAIPWYGAGVKTYAPTAPTNN